MEKELRFKEGQKVDYVLAGKVLFTATVVKAEEKRGEKPYTLLTDQGETKYANEELLYPTPETEMYKGYEIRTTPNGTHFASLIYKNDQPVGGTFAGPMDEKTSIEKAKVKIDSYGK